MKKLYLQVYILCALLLFISCGQTAIERDVDPFPEIDIPIVPNAYNVNKINNRPKYTKSVNYNLNVPYPASDVFNFYKDKFKKSGWIMNNAGSHWDTFIDGTRKGSPKVRQFLASWKDSKNEREIILAMRYQKDKDEDWNNELWVGCQMHVIIDPSELNEFFKRIEASGDYAELMELVDNYRKSDGEIDFIKALKNNPKNKLLIEYWKLTEKMSKELEKKVYKN